RTSGKGSRSGPLQRRADLEALAQEVAEAEAVRAAATAALERTLADLAAAEAAFAAAGEASERARQHELEAGALKGDAERAAVHAQREAADATAQVERLSTRLSEVEARLGALHGEIETHDVERVRVDERLGGERQRLVELETGQEAAREQRVKWQVDAAQVEARLAAARARARRPRATPQRRWRRRTRASLRRRPHSKPPARRSRPGVPKSTSSSSSGPRFSVDGAVSWRRSRPSGANRWTSCSAKRPKWRETWSGCVRRTSGCGRRSTRSGR